MFAPGVPQLMNEFDSSNSVLASLVVSIYILGNAFGPIVLAPLSGTNRMLSSPIYPFLMEAKAVNTHGRTIWSLAYLPRH